MTWYYEDGCKETFQWVKELCPQDKIVPMAVLINYKIKSLGVFIPNTLVAQWVKRWPFDLAVPSSSPARGEIFLTVNGVPSHTAFHYHPPIVLIYCWKGIKIASQPSIHLFYITCISAFKKIHENISE